MKRILVAVAGLLLAPFLYRQAKNWQKHHSTGNYAKGHKAAHVWAAQQADERSTAELWEL